ncbi:hypothetical protein PR202_ga25178 [Eleusine coracana subsp. coracana]|uniref:Uncharacterized protein n=1 Tax=Eleusine coracana subsp. coracana TaxID=191504 RepID=A0AAV5DAQ5_ELECO|nr:hypothetical protein PR202_ga25178 [Eleusine coracana subsp. coracana]
MAEAVVGLLICKLGEALLNKGAAYGASLLCTETSALKGLFGEIHRAMGWMEIMKAYLHDSEKLRDTKETTDTFVKKIRGLAFRIEDVVDEYEYKLQDGKHGRFAAKMKKRLQHGKAWRRLARELRDINADLEDTARQKNLCAVPEMARYGGGNGHDAGSLNPTLCFARNEDLVGIENNAEKLKGWILDSEVKSKIVTVWGMGGAGKTTLVDHVYKIVKEDFDVATWVTVSKSYQLEDLLKKIARGLGISVLDVSDSEMRSLGDAISNHLQGTSYMLVLDDVWEKDLWIDIMDIFPNNNCSSRFVFTSRNFEVASLATSNCSINLAPLQGDNSWKLFCNLTFRNVEDKSCPSELRNLAAKFLEKCDGLPLAIACIGRLLSCKPSTFSEWKKVYQELELQSSKHMVRGVHSILKVSLEDLSYELKNCFLHCAMFPEDYEIKRKRLIRHWITAGFVKEEENNTLEQVAEGFLNELVNRSLLQVIRHNEFGRITCCRMHDIIRHLAINKAEEECFGKIYEGSGTLKYGIRRLSIQNHNISPISHTGATNIRAIHAFTKILDVDLLRPILASSSLLSTLDLQGTQISVLPHEIFSLFNLRFLGLRLTRIECLPEAIRRLQNLEVLDALGTGLISLPKGLTTLKKLRYLYACTMVADGRFRYYGAVKVPSGIGSLTLLHALQDVKASLETLCDVANLRELRTFSVSDVTSEHSQNLCTAIMNMTHLVHLNISASSKNEVLPMEALHLPRTLRKLGLIGQLEKTRITWSHLSNLTKLVLVSSKLDEDFFSGLLSLHGLYSLAFNMAYDGKKMHFPVLPFPKLQELYIQGAPELSQVEIEEGALKSLVLLELSGCPELKCLPRGTEYLTALEELCLLDTSEELIEKLRQERDADACNEELMKIRQIRRVVVK